MKKILFAACLMALCGCDEKEKAQIVRWGYDLNDVEVFLIGTPFDWDDFVASKGLRMQYKTFQEGGTTAYMSGAVSQEASNRAAMASAQAASAQSIALINSGN